jgi:hypothetical protein
MSSRIGLFRLTGFAFFTVICMGCNPKAPEGGSATKAGPPPAPGVEEEHHGHSHASEGPHGGDLIELGNENYHAELVHDDETGAVTIYILDSAAKERVAIDAGEIVINLRRQGQGEQFKLAASPQNGDPAGQASRFVSSETALGDRIEAGDADARLVLNIGGKSYSGEIAHRHEHAHKVEK